MMELRTYNAGLFEFVTFDLLLPLIITSTLSTALYLLGRSTNHHKNDDIKRDNKQLLIITVIMGTIVPLAITIMNIVLYAGNDHADIGKYYAEAVVTDITDTNTPVTQTLGDTGSVNTINEVTVENNDRTYTFEVHDNVNIDVGDTIVFDSYKRHVGSNTPTTIEPESKRAVSQSVLDPGGQIIELPDGTQAQILNNVLVLDEG